MHSGTKGLRRHWFITGGIFEMEVQISGLEEEFAPNLLMCSHRNSVEQEIMIYKCEP